MSTHEHTLEQGTAPDRAAIRNYEWNFVEVCCVLCFVCVLIHHVYRMASRWWPVHCSNSMCWSRASKSFWRIRYLCGHPHEHTMNYTQAILGQIPWKALILDEAQRLRIHSKLLNVLQTIQAVCCMCCIVVLVCRLCYNVVQEHNVLLTGTPIQNSMEDLVSCAHMISFRLLFLSCFTRSGQCSTSLIQLCFLLWKHLLRCFASVRLRLLNCAVCCVVSEFWRFEIVRRGHESTRALANGYAQVTNQHNVFLLSL